VAELVVIDHVLIAERDPKHTLPDQRPDLMLDQLRCPAIRETLGKPLDQPNRAQSDDCAARNPSWPPLNLSTQPVGRITQNRSTRTTTLSKLQ
jgi:hypothetical protein